MIKLLQFLLHGCWHEWQAMASVPLVNGKLRTGDRFLSQCKKCYRIRAQDVR